MAQKSSNLPEKESPFEKSCMEKTYCTNFTKSSSRRRQTDRQFGRKTHSKQLGCCATHLRRHNSAPWRHHTARPTRPHGRRPPPPPYFRRPVEMRHHVACATWDHPE